MPDNQDDDRDQKDQNKINQTFVFAGSEGTKVTLTIEGKANAALPRQLKGPLGRTFTMSLQGLSGAGALQAGLSSLTNEQHATIQKLLSDQGAELAKSERDIVANGSLMIKNDIATAGRIGPIVRFDCTWFTWD